MDPRVIYQPKNPVASYTDEYGEERVIHAPKGKALRRYKNSDTPVQRMNRAVAILLGKRVRERRLALGLTMQQVCERAGFASKSPKQFMHHIEVAMRAEGVRLGTLYALTAALECEAGDLLPSRAEAMALAGVHAEAVSTIVARAA